MKKKWIRIFTVIGLSVSILTGCGSKQNMYESHKSGYKETSSIDGMTYDVPESALSLATAVTSISEDMEFDNSNMYVYKDGTTEYLLFQMDSIVIAAQKGTKFGFQQSTNKEETLKNEKLMNIWFDKETKSLKYEESKKENYKIIAKVAAQVSITDELYNDFVGELVVIENDEEWSMFIGVPADKYDDLTDKQKEVIEHVASSVKLNENTEKSTVNDEEVVITEENSTEEIVKNEKKNEEKAIESISTEENIEPSETITPEEISTEEPQTEIQEEPGTDEVIVNENETTEEPTTEMPKEEIKKEEPTIKEPKLEEQKVEKAQEEQNTSEIAKNDHSGKSLNLNNQKKVVRKKEIANSSSIYNLLNLGDIGIAMTKITDTNEYGMVNICIDNLYTEQKAIDIIKDELSKENRSYEEPPAGCTWNAIKYSLGTPLDQAYINIKLKGFDGEKLKYRGIVYTQRTYDLYGSIKENNGNYTNIYCYFAIPNGCKEYMLECGDGTIENTESGIVSAYYKVNTKELK